jgi:UPF0716 protein FxsA
MFIRLLFALIIVAGFPALEIWLLLLAGDWAGLWVLAWLALTAAAGLWLMREERDVWHSRLMGAALHGVNPLSTLMLSGRRLVAGFLLCFPGFITDAIALMLLAIPGPRPPPASRAQVMRDDVIEGEFRRDKDA